MSETVERQDLSKSRHGVSPRERYAGSPQEVVLESRDFEREVVLLGGSIGDACFVKISDDGGGVFKPHTQYESYPQKRQFISRERAAYLISRFLGFDFVPPTIIKIINGRDGSLQEFVEDAQVASEIEDVAQEVDNQELAKLKIFDFLITNWDRHVGNYLIKNRKIVAIDHGCTLELHDLSRVGSVFFREIPPDVADRLEQFAKSQEQLSILRDLLVELLGQPVTDQFMKRVTAFVESINEDYSFDLDKFGVLLGH